MLVSSSRCWIGLGGWLWLLAAMGTLGTFDNHNQMVLAEDADAADGATEDEEDPTNPPTALGWTGCVDFNKPGARVTIGEPTTICLVIADGTDWSTERTYMRVNFQPKADEYSRFHVPGSYQNLVVDADTRVAEIYQGKNITVHAESQTSLSFQKKYYDGFGKIFPYLTAVVDVDEGLVQGITWDDASLFCSKSDCEDNTYDFAGFAGTESEFRQPVAGCYIEEDACNELPAGATDCDLLLYVVWTGTDSNGDAFMSSSYRFSAFPIQDLGDRFSQNLPTFEIDLNPFNDEERV